MSQGAFSKLAKRAARFTGQPLSFGLAAGIVVSWILTGPIFHF
ncbi:low affinity iron permease family protein, partial [Dokdonella sp.]